MFEIYIFYQNNVLVVVELNILDALFEYNIHTLTHDHHQYE